MKKKTALDDYAYRASRRVKRVTSKHDSFSYPYLCTQRDIKLIKLGAEWLRKGLIKYESDKDYGYPMRSVIASILKGE